MNVTLTSLEALILKATNESLIQPDTAAVEAFCAVLREAEDGPQLAAQAFAARVHSQNPREALLALIMLDRCMRRCDDTFHAEIGKFRFLNELIKLVSPKYFAQRTAPGVRLRVLQLLHAWSIEYPKETKFKVAFDMLKNQGVVKETPPPLPPEELPGMSRPRAPNAMFEDEEKSKLLQKLLRSKKPEDLQHANRLIKTMVREEERRSEANSRRAKEVSEVLDSAELLRELLDNAADASSDEQQLIQELHTTCVRFRPVLLQLASSDTQVEDLSDILHANDVLDEVFEKYDAFLELNARNNVPGQNPQLNRNVSLLDFAGASVSRDETDVPKTSNSNVLNELGDIFGGESSSSNTAGTLKPVNLMQSDGTDLLRAKTNKVEGWSELDSLGEQLLKQSLPENARRIDSFNGKPGKKIPMNALETSPKHTEPPKNGEILDLDFFTKTPEEELKPSPPAKNANLAAANDVVMVDISMEEDSSSPPNLSSNNVGLKNDSPMDDLLDLGLTIENNAKCNEIENSLEEKDANTPTEQKDTKINKTSSVKSLTDINITLENVQPSKVQPLTAFEGEDGITVVLHFCKDKPRPDVNVIVISTTSKNISPIEDYKFQAVVPKGCKIRLLSPSGTSLPAYNPFLPPPALTQVLLLARPAPARALGLKFVITYVNQDEMCSEMGEVARLPLDQI